MKKHNGSKIIKGIRRSKGNTLCKVISFTMIFVMLFCISAYAETETISVKNDNGAIISIVADINYSETDDATQLDYVKSIIIENEEIEVITQYFNIRNSETDIVTYAIIYDGLTITERYLVNITLAEEIAIDRIYEGIIIDNNGEIIEPSNYNELNEAIQYSKVLGHAIENRTNYENNIIVNEQPAYVGFIGNARGLFDMLFESIQSIFNWLVSPNVIVFFGLGIILSLTTIGILIARRFFWGR